ERADVAPLVGRVVLPFHATVAARGEVAPVAFEGAVQQLVRQPGLLAARRERDGGRGRVEVAELGRARQVVDTVPTRGRAQRVEQVGLEAVARLGHAPGLLL